MRSATAIMAALAVCLAGAGCIETAPRLEPPMTQAPTLHLPAATVAAGPGGDAHNAMDSAKQWKEKHALRTEECLKLQRDNITLDKANRALAVQTAKLQAEMAATKKELSEANAMMGDLNKELNRWKHDVLGFRDEMRRAMRVQLALTTKILIQAGGEMPDIDVARAQVAPAGTTEQ